MYRERTISSSEFRGIVFLTWVVMTMTTMQTRWWRWATIDSGWGSSRRDKNSWGQPKTRLQLTHQTYNLLLHNHNLILAHKVLQLCHFLCYARYQFFWFSFCAQGIGLGSRPEVFCMILNNCSVCVYEREESSCVRVRVRDREKERERQRVRERVRSYVWYVVKSVLPLWHWHFPSAARAAVHSASSCSLLRTLQPHLALWNYRIELRHTCKMISYWLVTFFPYLRFVKMVKANLCLFMGSKSFRPNTAGLAEERTPTRISKHTILAIVDLDILIVCIK